MARASPQPRPLLIMLILGNAFALARPAFAASPSRTDRMIDVGGYRLHFHVIAGRGTPILFEAGGGDDGDVWAEVAQSVAEITAAPVITYDRAGFGRSEVLKGGDIGDHGILAGVAALK